MCEKCEKNQDFQKDNESHNNSMHADENLPTTSNCGRCGFSSDDENDLVNHRQTMHEEIIENVDENVVEASTSTSKQLKCEECDSFFSEGEMQQHKTGMHKLDKFICELSDLSATTSELVKEHE